ncbi:uncharacterized protein LOC116195998 isoform X2 [Punica granatum]|uniref:Uncharacterized protein LOC116195998 isoform X2 n=1 Tax=Punica granatum TaxID=22663 RepID=A0A6P8CFY5_PUNGR|nr:uncharacterized protein LOC116195998 isoform X2 [Punica granatum]
MAVSAFKSATRRGGAANSSSSAGREPPPEKKPGLPRRSRSVSAFSRSSKVSDFSNKRDNPLFCSGDSSPPEGNGASAVPKKLNADGDWSKVELNRVGGSKPGGGNRGVGSLGDDRRGRSTSRSSGKPSETGRSVSRGRVRSVSQRPVSRGHFVSSESEVEQETSPMRNYRNRTGLDLMRSSIESVDPGQVKALRTWSSQHPPVEPSTDSASRSRLEFPKWEDGHSAGSFSEVEEKTIKAVCEQMKSVQEQHLGEQPTNTSIYETVRSEVRQAISDIQSDLESSIRKNNPTAIASSDIVDIPPDLVNPGAVELVMDIRSEYAKKLEQERARKLRADLAVEEHRGEELSRILKEILPDPKASNSQKPRPARKASIERRKISKRLTEEAMAYFDECVSLSTFDSSDFSSPEDPPLRLVGDNKPVVSENESVLGADSTMTATCDVNHRFNSSQDLHQNAQFKSSCEHSSLRMAASDYMNSDPASSSSTTAEGRKCQFSFSGRPNSYSNLQQDIRKYIKTLETDPINDDHIPRSSRKSQYEVDGYDIQASMQGLLFDKVIHKSQVESGSLLLCGGGFSSIQFSPFGSII